jgi:hypothetical protein
MQKGMQNGELHVIGRKWVPRRRDADAILMAVVINPCSKCLVHAVYKSVHPLQQKHEYIQRDSIGNLN